MASRGHGWFDETKLLPGERIVRSGKARLRIPGPPYWWEGTLTLTSDRLFLLPNVEHPESGVAAFWLHDLMTSTSDARNRFSVGSGERKATFSLVSFSARPAQLIGNQARVWLRAIAELRPDARPRRAFEEEPRRRAAG